jgi:hypothetical protein
MSTHAAVLTDLAFESQVASRGDTDSLRHEALREVMQEGASPGLGSLLESQLATEAAMAGDASSSAELSSAVLASCFASAAFVLCRGDERFDAQEPSALSWQLKRKKATEAE